MKALLYGYSGEPEKYPIDTWLEVKFYNQDIQIDQGVHRLKVTRFKTWNNRRLKT